MSKDLFDAKVVELTGQHWENTQRALLLASLGQALNKSGFDLRVMLGGASLADYLKTELSDKVVVMVSPSNDLTHGVIPSQAFSEQMDRAALFTRVSPRPRVRYPEQVWKAFSTPIPPGYKRVLLFEPSAGYQDLPDTSPALVANAGNIVPDGMVVGFDSLGTVSRPRQISTNIQAWMHSRPGVLAKLHQVEPENKEGVGQARSATGSTLWELLISSLNERDLARMSVPLDVVIKLMQVHLPK